MSKSKSSPRVFSRAFKLGIIRRMLAGEKRERLGARTEADAQGSVRLARPLPVGRSAGSALSRSTAQSRGSASAARGETAKACPPGEGPKPRTGFGSRQSGPQCDAQPWQNYPSNRTPRPAAVISAVGQQETSHLFLVHLHPPD